MGKPIIATDVPGCREVVDNGISGFLCQPRNSMDLCEKMLRMIKLTPEEREKMGHTGREKVLREFDEKIITTIYLAEIGKVLRNNAGDTEKNH
jgi:glycosyltransferase involved in cell wall biosynthesis